MSSPFDVEWPSRSPWQLFYGAIHALRWQWFARRATRLPIPVISIGNLHWGGTGKTPLVAAVAAHLRDRGIRPTILTRGYRSQGRGVRVVSTGDGPLLGPRVAGDEPVLLAGELEGVAVVVGPDRAEAGRHALERIEPTPQVFVLDDGFSHLRLFRDIDIVAFPADDPFAGGRLPPGGKLREPLNSVTRADAALLTGSRSNNVDEFAAALRGFGFRGRAFDCPMRHLPARQLDGKALPADFRVLLVAAIARPDRFIRTVGEMDLDVTDVLTFSDHHEYSEKSLRQIEQSLADTGADVVLTTAKDRVKLFGRLGVPLAEVPMRAEPEAGFWEWLERRLQQLLPATG